MKCFAASVGIADVLALGAGGKAQEKSSCFALPG
jgi:hypothetical protein